MDQTWLGKAEARGFEKGKAVGEARVTKRMQTLVGKAEAQGFREGKAQGRAEAVDELRRLVLKRIEKRFGPVPDAVQKKVQTIASIGALFNLLEKLPSLQSAEDLLPRRNGGRKARLEETEPAMVSAGPLR